MRSPSTETTSPSMAGNALTTSWRMSPKVAPTWSATPASAGTAWTSKNKSAANRHQPLTLEPLTLPSPLRGEGSRLPLPSRERAGVRVGRLEDNGWLMDTEDVSEGGADLAQSGGSARGGEDRRQEVLAAAGRPLHRLERTRGGIAVAPLPQPLEPLGQAGGHGGIRLKEIGRRRRVGHEVVHADDDAGLALYPLLMAVRGVLDLALHERDGVDGAAHAVDLGDVVLRLFLDPSSEPLDRIGAAQRIHGIGHSGLVGHDLLRAQGG